ncbi:GNAT family N-acetyltransferase [Streptomyces radicis]|uniref:GNAT family N-acetyltransferase n=1 Tax=Streptomyces radicis TaxID=1750517 RepID=A0A3A9WE55_9ACTN|nr:GNAT family N-acetyltransferase [Streptomyces radicis]RKN11050.1 GNAT family N-acetyltransferase [Streptomyces radicis]RKN25313.1 GNAT family N-acetyltransferase [Streptomyces radicis]
MTTELRTVSKDELDAWYTALEWAFGGLKESADERRLWHELVDLDRSLGVWDGDRVVGSLGTFALGVSVPGGAVVPAAGITMVHVASTHRRRGLLRRMMRRALDDYREAGEPLALLTASEPDIYGRFGFGAATRRLSATVDSTRVRVNAPAGTDDIALSVADPVAAAPRCEELYARLVPRRPGMLERRPGWERLPLLDPPGEREGASARRCLLAERDGELVGYARFALRPAFRAAGPEGAVVVHDLEAATPAAYAALLRQLMEMDLMSTVVLRDLPVDAPLLHLVSDVRRCDLRLQDRLYARPLDVGAALAARSYATELDVVIDVADDVCPGNTGRWRLSGGPGGAVCARTGDAADLALPVRVLGAACLGGASLTALAGAGLVVEERAGALAAASVAFTSPVAPWLPHTF